MITFLNVIHITTIVLLVIAVLLQSGKGAEVSASFGGSSQTVFGSSGGVNFFQKLTYILAGIFMCTSLALTILPSKAKKSVFEGYTPPAATEGAKPVDAAAPAAAPAEAAKTEAAPAANTAPAAAAKTEAAPAANTAPATKTAPAAEQKK